MSKILITTSSFGKDDAEPLQMLQDSGFEILLNPYGRTLTKEESKMLMKEVDGMIAGTEVLDREVLLGASKLKYLCRLGAGVDKVDFEAAEELNIKVESTPEAHVKGVAELTLGGILSIARNISSSDSLLKKGEWQKKMGFLLHGKTIGLIGLGRVAKHLVRLLQPFQVKILASDPNADMDFAEKFGLEVVDASYIYKDSDIISLHIPYTMSNKYLINEAVFKMVKPTVVLVNTSRGGLVDEESLYKFLQANPQAQAYLDTFENEPYAGPIKDLPNALLTPHIGSYARETRREMEMDASSKLIKFFSYG